MTNYPQYPPYPQYPGTGQMPPRPSPPRSIRTAVILMYAGAALNLLQLILAVVAIGALRHAIQVRSPQLSLAQAGTLIIAAIVVLGIETALWLWMAWANNRGHGWARILSTVFFGLDTLLVLTSLAGSGANGFSGLLVWLIGLAVIVCLWTRNSSAYFNALKEGAGYWPGGYGPAGPYGQQGYRQPDRYDQQPGPYGGERPPYGQQPPYGQEPPYGQQSPQQQPPGRSQGDQGD
jgi:hypothetical protein